MKQNEKQKPLPRRSNLNQKPCGGAMVCLVAACKSLYGQDNKKLVTVNEWQSKLYKWPLAGEKLGERTAIPIPSSLLFAK